MIPYRIIWEKWHDPFLEAVREDAENDGPGAYQRLEREGRVGIYQGPALCGPAGIVPLNELNCPSKNFNLWVGHASFSLDSNVVDRMKAVPGVEVLKVWTPYRFWLGVGKAFEENSVKTSVLLASRAPRPKAQADTEAGRLEALREIAAARYKYWAILVLDSGKLDVLGGDDKEEVAARLKKCQARRVITSWSRDPDAKSN